MPQNIVLSAIFGLIELFRLAVISTIPAFVVALAAEQLHHKLSKRFFLSWAKSALISTYLVVTLLLIFLYAFPAYLGWTESPLAGQPVPPELQPTLLDIIAMLFFSLMKILLSALIYSILLLPPIFFATFVFEKLREREKPLPELANKFIAVFATTLLIWIVLLFVFPFAIGGLLYLLYWS